MFTKYSQFSENYAVTQTKPTRQCDIGIEDDCQSFQLV